MGLLYNNPPASWGYWNLPAWHAESQSLTSGWWRKVGIYGKAQGTEQGNWCWIPRLPKEWGVKALPDRHGGWVVRVHRVSKSWVSGWYSCLPFGWWGLVSKDFMVEGGLQLVHRFTCKENLEFPAWTWNSPKQILGRTMASRIVIYWRNKWLLESSDYSQLCHSLNSENSFW